MMETVLVVGLGPEGVEGLSAGLRERIAQANELWGSERLLALWPEHPAEKFELAANIPLLVERICAREGRRLVVLASGDPGFYGIAGALLRHLPPDELEIVPAVTSLQWAFARVGVAWNDAFLTSAHARPLAEVVGWAKRVPKLGILTDPKHSPAVIARALIGAGLPDCRAVVGENIGLDGERFTDTRLYRLPDLSFSALNVVLLIQDPGWSPVALYAPRADQVYAHRRGLITKADVRALSMARLALCETDTVWDIGAGSGAMSVEMAELAWRGEVFAVEQDGENLGHIRENIRRFGILNVTPVEGRAPAVLKGLPPPTAVFVGGTGGEMEAILSHVGKTAHSGCRVVVNVATLEHLGEALRVMNGLKWPFQVSQVSLSYGRDVAGLTRLAPLNPVFILSGKVR